MFKDALAHTAVALSCSQDLDTDQSLSDFMRTHCWGRHCTSTSSSFSPHSAMLGHREQCLCAPFSRICHPPTLHMHVYLCMERLQPLESRLWLDSQACYVRLIAILPDFARLTKSTPPPDRRSTKARRQNCRLHSFRANPCHRRRGSHTLDTYSIPPLAS